MQSWAPPRNALGNNRIWDLIGLEQAFGGARIVDVSAVVDWNWMPNTTILSLPPPRDRLVSRVSYTMWRGRVPSCHTGHNRTQCWHAAATQPQLLPRQLFIFPVFDENRKVADAGAAPFRAPGAIRQRRRRGLFWIWQFLWLPARTELFLVSGSD